MVSAVLSHAHWSPSPSFYPSSPGHCQSIAKSKVLIESQHICLNYPNIVLEKNKSAEQIQHICEQMHTSNAYRCV